MNDYFRVFIPKDIYWSRTWKRLEKNIIARVGAAALHGLGLWR